MSAGPEAIRERIRVLEQRLENRRTRLREDTREAKVAAVDTARRWLPVAVAAGAGLATLWLAHRTRSADHGLRLRRFAPEPEAQATRRGVRWASLLGLAGSAYRLGTSPQARVLLDAFRRRRTSRS